MAPLEQATAAGSLEPCFEESGLETLLHRYGNSSLSYSFKQPGMTYFGDVESGLLAYRKQWGAAIVLGNPLCSPRNSKQLLNEFLDHHPNALFAQVEYPIARELHALGLFITPAGVDAMVDIQTFSLDGRRRQDLRHYRNRSLSAGVTVQESVDTHRLRERLNAISKVWIRSKQVHTRELEFLIRPLSLQPELGTRVFTAVLENQLAGFVVFDPIYQDGHIGGYTASILRSVPNVPKGTLDAIILHALTIFQMEGIQELSLGVSPFWHMDVHKTDFDRLSTPLYHACHFLSRFSWQPIVNTRGLCFHKSRYRPAEKPVYLASTSPIGIEHMAALLKVCKIL
jgi:lysylphosphatidylglycerol synthetase-like protein (DUF2156 family)